MGGGEEGGGSEVGRGKSCSWGVERAVGCVTGTANGGGREAWFAVCVTWSSESSSDGVVKERYVNKKI